MWDQLRTQVGSLFVRFGEALVAVIPALLVLLASVLVGALVGLLVRAVLTLFFRLTRRGGQKPASASTQLLSAAGVQGDPLRFVGIASFWVAVGVALAAGVNALEPSGLKVVLTEVVSYIPRLLAAALILVLGLGLAVLARRSVLIAAVNAGLPWARGGARAVHVVVIVFFVAAALDQLGVGRSIIVAAFSITAGGLVLALALAFGLGARDLARKWLEKQLRAEQEDTGIRHV